MAEKKVKKLSWKAVRRGDIYCAPACGANCTWAAYQKALERGRLCADELGKGWTVRVYENMGWHTAVVSPCKRVKVSIHPVHGTPSETLIGTLCNYTAFLGDADDVSCSGKWAENGDTPAEAVNNVVRVAMEDLARLNAYIRALPRRNGKQIAS